MQTFLPFSSFTESAECLDMKRLLCQIKEAYQIIHNQFPNHPASLMWTGHRSALRLYFNVVLEEYKRRGRKHQYSPLGIPQCITMPSWIGNDVFHLSQKVNLLRKDYLHYSQYFEVPKQFNYPEGYYWPVVNGKKSQTDTENWEAFFKMYGEGIMAFINGKFEHDDALNYSNKSFE